MACPIMKTDCVMLILCMMLTPAYRRSTIQITLTYLELSEIKELDEITEIATKE